MYFSTVSGNRDGQDSVIAVNVNISDCVNLSFNCSNSIDDPVFDGVRSLAVL